MHDICIYTCIYAYIYIYIPNNTYVCVYIYIYIYIMPQSCLSPLHKLLRRGDPSRVIPRPGAQLRTRQKSLASRRGQDKYCFFR